MKFGGGGGALIAIRQIDPFCDRSICPKNDIDVAGADFDTHKPIVIILTEMLPRDYVLRYQMDDNLFFTSPKYRLYSL